jgi:hypothetical protein
VRSQYQNANAEIDRNTTISSSPTGTSKLPGRVGRVASSRFAVKRDTTNRSFLVAMGVHAGAVIATGIATLGAPRTLGGLSSSKDLAATFAAVRIPLNLPAQPRQ